MRRSQACCSIMHALLSVKYWVAVLQDGQVAESKIKLRAGDTLVINTVAGNVQLNYLRRFLAEGFQAHLQGNELLHQASSWQACRVI
jgi:hypothetical protein